jgi:AAA+ ATPase superfamily predicted ATPase
MNEVSQEEREFVRDELAWLAEWIRSRYPKLSFGDIRRFLREMISVSV